MFDRQKLTAWMRAHPLKSAGAATVALVALSLWAGTESPTYQDCKNEQEKAYADDYTDHAGKDAVTFAICDAQVIANNGEFITALATVALVMSTILLWIATREAAEAARKGVEALPIIERGYAYPVITNPGAINQVIAAEEDQSAELSFHIKNYGKTPIVLNLVIAGCGTRKTIGRNSEWLSVDDPILGVGEHTRPLMRKFSPQLEDGPKALIGLNMNPVFFEGRIIYSDIWDNEFQTWFRFIWEPEPDLGRWRLSGLKIEEHDGEKEWDKFLKG